MTNGRMEMIKDELIKKIKEDITKSGFPLELFVLQSCIEKQMYATSNVQYQIGDEIKEIDIIAEIFDEIYPKNLLPQFTLSKLIIECKKSIKKPWVFFSMAKYQKQDMLSQLKYLSAYDTILSSFQSRNLIFHLYDKRINHHYLDASIPKCISYVEAFDDPHKQSTIFDAVESVFSYLTMSYKRQQEIGREPYDVDSSFYYPIVVLDGLLFEASFDKEELNILERNHIQYVRFNARNTNVVDVVTKSYFKDFLDLLIRDHNELLNAIGSLPLSDHVKATIREKWEKGSTR
jgi:hypothetical protein